MNASIEAARAGEAEEAAASSSEGMKVTETTVQDMKTCKEILEGIYALTKDLKQE